MIDFPDLAKPKPQALFCKVINDIPDPLVPSGAPDVTGNRPHDIVDVWPHGQIGYQGDRWRDRAQKFFAANLNGQAPWIGVALGLGPKLLNRRITLSNCVAGMCARLILGRRSVKLECRSDDTCVLMSVEENFAKAGLIFCRFTIHLDADNNRDFRQFDRLHPETETAQPDMKANPSGQRRRGAISAFVNLIPRSGGKYA